MRTLAFRVLCSALLSCSVLSLVHADDTEVFYNRNAADLNLRPNVLFLLDTSASMNRNDTGKNKRIDTLRSVITDIINENDDINIGMMRLNGTGGGGAVIHPVARLDEPVCYGNCGIIDISQSMRSTDDDGVQRLDGSVVLDETTLPLAASSAVEENTVALRFDELPIPQGATIEYAFLDLQQNGTSSGIGEVLVQAEAADDSAPLEPTNNNIGLRTRTVASVNWQPYDVGPDNPMSSPNLTAPVQEVMNRPGWCGGQALTLLVQGTAVNSAWAYDATEKNAPSLRIGYRNPQLGSGASGCRIRTAASQVSSNDDDATELYGSFWNAGTVNLNDQTISLPAGALGRQFAGLRFPGLNVPRNAEVVKAWVQFESAEASTVSSTLVYRALASDDVPPFTRNWWDRLSLRNWGNVWAIEYTPDNRPGNEVFNSVDLSAVVSESTSRLGWVSGQAFGLVIEAAGNQLNGFNFKTHDRSATSAPKLIVQYKERLDPATVIALGQNGRDSLLAELEAMGVTGNTPLVEAYYEAALYYRNQAIDYGTQRGANGSSTYRVSHPASYTGGTLDRPANCTSADLNASVCKSERILHVPQPAIYTSPISHACQSSQIVILSDGAANSNNAVDRIQSMIGKSCVPGGGAGHCGPDLATFLNTTDQSTAFDGSQNVTTHTIGYTAYHELLDSIAQAGGGSYYTALDHDGLIASFNAILNDVRSVDTTFVAPSATVSQFNRLAHSENVYFALFKPVSSPLWPGNLKRYKIGKDSSGTIALLDAKGNNAVDPNTGFFSTTAYSFWTETTQDGNDVRLGGAAERLKSNNNRKVYTYTGDPAAIPPGGVALTNPTHRLARSNRAVSAAMIGTPAPLRNAVLDWAVGQDLFDEDGDGSTTDQRHVIGDPMHSAPLIVNYDNGSGGFDSRIYLATNAGFLHQIDEATGDEHFAFMPQELLPMLYDGFANDPASTHEYGLDGHISLYHDDLNGDLIVNNSEKALLYVGMRRGGQNYYALDISNPNAPRLAWSIRGGAGGTTGFSELAQSWSEMILTRIQINGTIRPVLVFSAGYDVNQDPIPNAPWTLRTADSRGRGFYVVDAETGALLWSVLGVNQGGGADVAGAGAQFHNAMDYSIAASPTVVDFDFDGLAEHIFLADLGGQVWRFDVIPNHTQGKLFAGGRMARFGDSTRLTQTRRFYHAPDITEIRVNGVPAFAVSIGSGWRAHPLETTTEDRFYSFTSEAAGEIAPGYGRLINPKRLTQGWRPLTDSDLESADLNSAVDEPPQYGWYLDFALRGEKVLGTSLTLQNVLYFTAYRPESSGAGCEAALGGSATYRLNLLDGSPAFDLDGSGTITADDVATENDMGGIPAEVGVLMVESKTPDGTGNELSAVGTIGTEFFDLQLNNLTQRTYWVDIGRSDR